MSSPATRNRFERHPRLTLALVVLVLLGALAAADHLAARARNGRPNVGEPSAAYHHGLKSDFEGEVVQPMSRTRVVTNSLGLRDRARRHVPLRSDKRRLVFLGDSFTFGMGVPYEATFVARFAGQLDPSRFEVLNAGCASYSPKLYYLRARHLLEEEGLRFDELFVFIDPGDVQDELGYEGFEPAAGRSLREFLVKNSWVFRRLDRTLLRRADLLGSEIAPAESLARDRPRWYAPEAFEAWGRRGLELADRNMEALRELCARHGIELHVAVYPYPANLLAAECDSPQVAHWKRFADQAGAGFLDLFPPFCAEPPAIAVKQYFIAKDFHWNAAGHQLVADALLAYHRQQPPTRGANDERP